MSIREDLSMHVRMIACALMIAFAMGAISCATTPAAAPVKPPAAQATAPAQAPAAATSHKYSTSETPIGELLDNPKTRAVVDQNLPGFSSAPQIDMARGMTLKGIQPYATDKITDELLAKIDAGLAAVSSQ